jgi:hypothetical protein
MRLKGNDKLFPTLKARERDEHERHEWMYTTQRKRLGQISEELLSQFFLYSSSLIAELSFAPNDWC